MIVYSDGENVSLEEVKNHFDKFMVKDFVKSVKGTSFPKYFDKTVTQEEFENQMDMFFTEIQALLPHMSVRQIFQMRLFPAVLSGI